MACITCVGSLYVSVEESKGECVRAAWETEVTDVVK